MSIRKMMLGGLVLAAAFATADVDAKEMAGWKVVGTGTGIVEGQKYSLFNLDQNGYLRMQDRAGANLGWASAANNGMSIKRQSGGGPLKCGEMFGLYIEKEWIMYDSQRFGINLSSRTQISNEYYQWKFTNCTDGAVIQLNQAVTITNTKENDALVGCKRTVGVNLCWANDTATVAGKNYRKADVPRR